VPVRKIPRSYQHATGLIATDKSDQSTAYESGNEYGCQKLIGFNLNVLKYEEQPVKIQFKGEDGKQHSYTPDILVHYRTDIAPAKNWKPLLVEVKDRSTLFKEWHELKPKFRAARRYGRERGCEFTVITDREIWTPYLRNVILLLEFRWLPIDEVYTNLLLETLSEVGESTPQSLLSTITEDRNKVGEMIPALWQLIANYEIGTNLEELLTMSSPIWPKLWERRNDVHDPIHQLYRGRCRRLRWQALRYYPHLEF
jgi:hypothetical protein